MNAAAINLGEARIDVKFSRFLAQINKLFQRKYYLHAQPDVLALMRTSDAFVQGIVNTVGLIVSLQAIPKAVNAHGISSVNADSRLFYVIDTFLKMCDEQHQAYEALSGTWPLAIAALKGRVLSAFPYDYLLVRGFAALPEDIQTDLFTLLEVLDKLQAEAKVEGSFVEFVQAYFAEHGDAFWERLEGRFNARLAVRDKRRDMVKLALAAKQKKQRETEIEMTPLIMPIPMPIPGLVPVRQDAELAAPESVAEPISGLQASQLVADSVEVPPVEDVVKDAAAHVLEVAEEFVNANARRKGLLSRLGGVLKAPVRLMFSERETTQETVE